MEKLPGYILMGVGLPGILFFLKYNGQGIPLKELWFVLCIFMIIGGAYLFAKNKLKQLNNYSHTSNSNRLAEIEQLKRTGEKIKLTLENAEIISRSYQQQIINDGLPSRMEILDALYDSNRNYKTQEVQQTYIVFHKQYNRKTYKFVSQATTQNAYTVKTFVDRQNGIDLYIDPKNPTRYYFDLPYL